MTNPQLLKDLGKRISTILHVSTDYLLFGRGSRGEISGIASKIQSLSAEQQAATGQIVDLFLDSDP